MFEKWLLLLLLFLQDREKQQVNKFLIKWTTREIQLNICELLGIFLLSSQPWTVKTAPFGDLETSFMRIRVFNVFIRLLPWATPNLDLPCYASMNAFCLILSRFPSPRRLPFFFLFFFEFILSWYCLYK